MAALVEPRTRGGEITIPVGDPAAIRGAANRLRQVSARVLATAAVRGGAAQDLALYWDGAVAEQVRVELGQLQARALRLLPNIGDAGSALGRYADVLEQTIGHAKSLRARAAQARTEHLRTIAVAGASADPATRALLTERAHRDLDDTMRTIRRTYGRALDELMDAGTVCARTLARCTAAAPGAGFGPGGVREGLLAGLPVVQDQIRSATVRPVGHVVAHEPENLWDQVLTTAGDAAAWGYNHTAVPLVNGTANVVEAMAEHPEDVIEMAAGVGTALIGAGGVGAGGFVSASGVGAVAGVPAIVVSGTVVATGVTTATKGATDLLQHARENDNRLLNEVSVAPKVGSRGTAGDPLPDSLRPDTAGPNWKGSITMKHGNGEIWQVPDLPPGAHKDANSIRIMDPGADPAYPNGYVRFYNEGGQPLDINGKPTGRDQTHFPIRADGTYDVPKGWSP